MLLIRSMSKRWYENLRLLIDCHIVHVLVICALCIAKFIFVSFRCGNNMFLLFAIFDNYFHILIIHLYMFPYHLCLRFSLANVYVCYSLRLIKSILFAYFLCLKLNVLLKYQYNIYYYFSTIMFLFINFYYFQQLQ